MSNLTNYYKLLGVDENASAREITRAYRKLALKYHPDLAKHNNPEQIDFRQINDAYRVLSSPRQRREYNLKFRNRAINSQKLSITEDSLTPFLSKAISITKLSCKKLKQLIGSSEYLDSKKIYSEIELSHNIAEIGGIQEFDFKICGYNFLGQEISKEKKLRISIPPQLKHGSILRLKGLQDEFISEVIFKVKLVN